MNVTTAVLVTAASAFLVASGSGQAQNVTGVVVDEAGQAIAGVACRVIGWPLPGGGQVHYSGMPRDHFTDTNGSFTISLPRSDPMVDLQFDHPEHGPVFLYEVHPGTSPLKIVMQKGKILKGRIVDDQGAPIKQTVLELQMAQSDRWYQRRGHTDSSGEFHFRISEPPDRHSWLLNYAGKAFAIDYSQITPETVVELRIDVKMTLKAAPHPASESR